MIFVVADLQCQFDAQSATGETRLRDDVTRAVGSSYRKVAQRCGGRRGDRNLRAPDARIVNDDRCSDARNEWRLAVDVRDEFVIVRVFNNREDAEEPRLNRSIDEDGGDRHE